MLGPVILLLVGFILVASGNIMGGVFTDKIEQRLVRGDQNIADDQKIRKIWGWISGVGLGFVLGVALLYVYQ